MHVLLELEAETQLPCHSEYVSHIFVCVFLSLN